MPVCSSRWCLSGPPRTIALPSAGGHIPAPQSFTTPVQAPPPVRAQLSMGGPPPVTTPATPLTPVTPAVLPPQTDGGSRPLSTTASSSSTAAAGGGARGGGEAAGTRPRLQAKKIALPSSALSALDDDEWGATSSSSDAAVVTGETPEVESEARSSRVPGVASAVAASSSAAAASSSPMAGLPDSQLAAWEPLAAAAVAPVDAGQAVTTSANGHCGRQGGPRGCVSCDKPQRCSCACSFTITYCPRGGTSGSTSGCTSGCTSGIAIGSTICIAIGSTIAIGSASPGRMGRCRH